MFREIICIYLLAYLFSGSDAYLQVKGKEFYYKGQKIFISGANIAWNRLGSDWGNGGKYREHRTK
ncbi:unnamed protein product [Oppiella nova]|uniref:Uncharacterized protein n=1 Tax=Oppiella nova TaxID=334625 RepID=A0A7R9QZ71_9ACAR|nr:unnamed protein product [Oppiella nova]CAG2180914.1 unnamed protein product [Oppiella nova]